MASQYYVGIDVGRRQHSLAVLAADRPSTWTQIAVFPFSADAPGFIAALHYLAQAGAAPGVTRCALEATGGYYSRPIYAALRAHGYAVQWIKNPAVHDLRETVYGRRSKTDAEDARLIARLLYLQEAVGQEYAFHLVQSGDERYQYLRRLVDLRWKQVQARRRASNQLTQVLDVLFPEFRLIFRKSVTGPTALHLLRRFPTVDAIADASVEDLHQVLVGEAKSLRHQTAAPQLKQWAQETAGLQGGTGPLQLAQEWLVQTLTDLDRSVADLDQRLAAAVQPLPEAGVLATFPAMSPTRVATLLAGMGAPVTQFPTDRTLRKQWGWYVEVEQSGARYRSRLGRGGNRGTRRELYLLAMQLVQDRAADNPFRHYYRRLVQGNPTPKVPKVALGHVASKLTSVMFVCMRRGTPYDPQQLWRHMGITVSA